MAGTTPYTFTALELLTAAKMNAIQTNMQVVLDAINEPVVFPLVLNTDTALSAGDGIVQFHIPPKMNGWTLTGITATRSAGTGVLTIQVNNVTQAADMLSTRITIDSGEQSSSTAATPAVIDTANDDAASYDRIRVDVDVAGTGTYNATLNLEFSRP